MNESEVLFKCGLAYEKNGDFPSAEREYKKSSIKGNDKAKQRLFDQNFQKINSMFKRAKSSDYDLESYDFDQRVQAQRSLGLIFLYGHLGAPQSTIMAHFWFSISANNGDIESHYYLAQLYEQIIQQVSYEGLEKNMPGALAHYLIAANEGHLASAFRYVNYMLSANKPQD